ncbi:hypothetical protein [Paraliomyxa miuraensis]|uniref:hypothetical protein n=1 Tax=Paraliomyxa miuraensis TaxID=376150 RepID=UPI002251ED9D|nr:hypothetical protein [Paraliomyxa miuraensis]MCX4243571.1 hypothetical protein [Paraliomyxa miuraensis]
MSEHDDEDRRMILARRQRFIALALAGLGGAAGACAGRNAGSEHPEQADADEAGEQDGAEGVDPIDQPPPRPPKELDPPRRKWTRPQPCLRVDLPDDEAP